MVYGQLQRAPAGGLVAASAAAPTQNLLILTAAGPRWTVEHGLGPTCGPWQGTQEGEIAMSSLNSRNEAMKTRRGTMPEASTRAARSRPQRLARGRWRYLIGASALAALAT